MGNNIPVTQADRDAAASLAALGSELAEMRRDGRHDGLPSVQAFTSHRLTASADIIAWLEQQGRAGFALAALIRRGEHLT